MDSFVIQGGSPLHGEITNTGAKNATLPLMGAALLSKEASFLSGVPDLSDVHGMTAILEGLGAQVERNGDEMTILLEQARCTEISEELMREMRSSIFLLGPLLSRFGEVRASYPGGCDIGQRPIDLHLKGLAALGADITEEHGYLYLRSAGRLHGAEIHLDIPSVGATENIMMAAVLAEGETIIHHAAREPEIVDLQMFLQAMGAQVKGAGSDTILIRGVEELQGCRYRVMPDRIVAGTLAIAAAITRGDVTIHRFNTRHLEPLLYKLREAGAVYSIKGDTLRIQAGGRLRAVDIYTSPYPGFPTDLQSPMMALLATCEGTSMVIENIFEGRYKHVEELRRMGAQIRVEARLAVVHGVGRLKNARVQATDLRAGAALVLAALAAEGESVVSDVQHIDRGYQRFEEMLTAVGANIRRVGEA